MKVFNTLTRKKEEFVPMDPNNVKMYSCGPTVYNFFHIGNARPFIIFDVFRRFLEYRGYKVTFVQNFTDIDDKVIRRANEEGVTYKDVSEKYIKEYFTDAKGLGIKEATVHPKATENINEIIKIVKTLEDKGYAYEKNGDVYYRAKKFDGYGKLSHQPLEELEAGARIDVNDIKEDAMDFALWKAAKPGEPSWDSPWGKGRPGWHIECSAMANKYLGETIDVHSGGLDLIFPHHENEIAQSEAANGKPFAHYWMHNAFLTIDNQKMSKSLGNFFTVRDAAEKYGYEAIRFFMLSAHYRSPLNYSAESLEQAVSALSRLRNMFDNLEFYKENFKNEKMTEDDAKVFAKLPEYKEKFISSMENDLNTADAIAAIFEMVKEINGAISGGEASREFCEKAESAARELCGVLGIAEKKEDNALDTEIEALIEKRQEARKAKNFAEADRIRDELKNMGIVLEDTPQGVKWSKK